MIQECWKPVEGYANLGLYYEVSNLGNVRSKDRTIKCKNGVIVTKRGKVLSQNIDKCGYKVVRLMGEGIDKTIKVHRLVAFAFLDKPVDCDCVNHKDENKENNKVNNLEWCTVIHNSNYGTRNERISKSRMGIGKGRKLSPETKRKMSESHSKLLGRPVSEETRKKTSASLKKYYAEKRNAV